MSSNYNKNEHNNDDDGGNNNSNNNHNTGNTAADSLFFLPPPFPGRGNDAFPVETAALQLQDLEHAFATPLMVDTTVAASQHASKTHNQQQDLPPDPLANAAAQMQAAVAAAAVTNNTTNSTNSNNDNPLATLAAASPDPKDKQQQQSQTKRNAWTPQQENELLKRQLAEREQEIQKLKQQLLKTTATAGNPQRSFAVANRTANLIGDAVLELASNDGTIDPNRIKNLHERWRARFQQLVHYKLQHGHTNVSKADDAPLHAWVRKQRTNKLIRDRTNGVKGLAREQVDALDSIGFEWVIGVGKRPHIKNDQWQMNYEKLMHYRNEHGSLPISIPSDKPLTKWMQNQRARKKLLQEHGPTRSKGMTWERVQKLELLGFKWASKDRGHVDGR